MEGVKKKKTRVTEWQREKIIELKKAGKTLAQIAKHVKRSPATCHSVLRKEGLVTHRVKA